MSSEIQKHSNSTLKKNQNLFNAQIISFQKKKIYNSKNLKVNTQSFWSIMDKSNEDQLRAIVGICFMLGALTFLGLYSQLI